jgi:hypothetical protein
MLIPPYHYRFSTHADDSRLSVYGAPILCAPQLGVDPPPVHHLFGIYWDEDHDDRVLHLADALYHHNVLTDFLAFYEHEGSLFTVLKDRLTPTRVAQALAILDGTCSFDVLEDTWFWQATNPRLDLQAPGYLKFENGQAENYLEGPFDSALQTDIVRHKLGGIVKVDQSRSSGFSR